MLYKRAVQKDISDADVKVSLARQQLTTDLLDQKQKGTLNHEEFSQHVSDTLDAAGENINTREAQHRFDQMKASASLEFAHQSIVGQSELEGAKTLANFKQASDADVNTIASDPSQFKSSLAKREQWVDDQVQSGLLQFTDAEKLKVNAGKQYAEAYIRGIAKPDPQFAQAILNDPKSEVAKYLDENSRYTMQREVDQYARSKEVEKERMEKLAQKAADAKSREIQEGWYDKLAKGQLSTNDVNFGPGHKEVDWETKKRFVDMMKASNTEKIGSDNPTMHWAVGDMMKAYNDPTKQIKTEGDITDLYVSGKINMEGMKALRQEFVNSNTGSSNTELTNFKKTGLWKDMYQQIAKPNAMGIPDPAGVGNFYQWQQEALNVMHKGQKDGTFTNDWLTDPKNENYLGKNADKYQRSMKDIMSDQAARLRGAKRPAPSETTLMSLPDGSEVYIPNKNVGEAEKRGAKKKGK